MKFLRSTPGLILTVTFAFFALTSLFFLISGHAPLALIGQMITGAYGDGFAWSETLIKTTPILLCALAVALPARLGLISVGAEGQFHFGALVATGFMLLLIQASVWVLLPVILMGAMLGGAIWGGLAGVLKARLGVNETICTLLLNYVGIALVEYVIHGPWKDPESANWPYAKPFPEAGILPTFFGTRVHLGLVIGVVAAVVLHVLLTRTRWGLELRLLAGNRKAATRAGLPFGLQVLIVMGMAGALAGLAGLGEASVIQGRLQSRLSSGFGLSGFLVAWLSGQHFLRMIPVAILMGGLLTSADTLQLFASLPASSAIVLQGLLFVTVLAVPKMFRRSDA